MSSNGHDRLDRIEANLDRLAQAMLGLAEHAERTDARIDALVEAQKRTDEHMAATDERLNALITIVDEMIRHRPPQ